MREKFNYSSESIPVEQLEHALKIAAKVVAMYGDVYLPGFIRLKNEVSKAKQISEAKAEAILLASSMGNI